MSGRDDAQAADLVDGAVDALMETYTDWWHKEEVRPGVVVMGRPDGRRYEVTITARPLPPSPVGVQKEGSSDE